MNFYPDELDEDYLNSHLGQYAYGDEELMQELGLPQGYGYYDDPHSNIQQYGILADTEMLRRQDGLEAQRNMDPHMLHLDPRIEPALAPYNMEQDMEGQSLRDMRDTEIINNPGFHSRQEVDIARHRVDARARMANWGTDADYRERNRTNVRERLWRRHAERLDNPEEYMQSQRNRYMEETLREEDVENAWRAHEQVHPWSSVVEPRAGIEGVVYEGAPDDLMQRGRPSRAGGLLRFRPPYGRRFDHDAEIAAELRAEQLFPEARRDLLPDEYIIPPY